MHLPRQGAGHRVHVTQLPSTNGQQPLLINQNQPPRQATPPSALSVNISELSSGEQPRVQDATLRPQQERVTPHPPDIIRAPRRPATHGGRHQAPQQRAIRGAIEDTVGALCAVGGVSFAPFDAVNGVRSFCCPPRSPSVHPGRGALVVGWSWGYVSGRAGPFRGPFFFRAFAHLFFHGYMRARAAIFLDAERFTFVYGGCGWVGCWLGRVYCRGRFFSFDVFIPTLTIHTVGDRHRSVLRQRFRLHQ